MDLGFWEMVVIGLLSLLVMGPEKWMSLAMETGRWYGRLQRSFRNVRKTVQAELEREESLSDTQKIQPGKSLPSAAPPRPRPEAPLPPADNEAKAEPEPR